jgi:hypothetical protein
MQGIGMELKHIPSKHPAFYLKRIRIRIQEAKPTRIQADPDPKHCIQVN